MRAPRRASLWCAMACLVMGVASCDDDAAVGGLDGPGLASSKGDLPTGFTADGTPPPIVGSYRFELVSEVTTRDEGGLFTSPSETTSTVKVEGVIEASQDGAAFTFHLAPCGIALPEVAGYEPVVDQGTIRRLPAIVSTGQLHDAGERAMFQTEPTAWVVGAELSDSRADVLPDDGADPRVQDVDLDGEPGITMLLEGWAIYGAMRLSFQLQGEVGDGHLLSGAAEVSMDTAVYGDTVPLINVAKKIRDMQDETTVVSESHHFEMHPFDASGITCEQAFDGAPIPVASPVTGTGELGGPCVEGDACHSAGSTCLTDGMGFPDGYCSAPCEVLCEGGPDDQPPLCATASSMGGEAGGSWCVTRCEADGGTCRQGYRCAPVTLDGQGSVFAYGCIPAEEVSDPDPTDPDPTDPDPTDPDPEPAPIEDCLQALDDRGIEYVLSSSPNESPEGHPELVCSIKDAVLVNGTLAGVNFRYASVSTGVTNIFASCELAIAMHDMAQLVAAAGVTDVIHLGVYNCRTISGTAKLSEHGHANAIDIGAVRFDDGTVWTVVDDWEVGSADPTTPGGTWLQWLVEELYVKWIFNVILTPEYDNQHHDHVHCDLSVGDHVLH